MKLQVLKPHDDAESYNRTRPPVLVTVTRRLGDFAVRGRFQNLRYDFLRRIRHVFLQISMRVARDIVKPEKTGCNRVVSQNACSILYSGREAVRGSTHGTQLHNTREKATTAQQTGYFGGSNPTENPQPRRKSTARQADFPVAGSPQRTQQNRPNLACLTVRA
jgi:hypothetical protein